MSAMGNKNAGVADNVSNKTDGASCPPLGVPREGGAAAGQLLEAQVRHMQAHILGQSQSQIHVLDGLASGPFDHIVDG